MIKRKAALLAAALMMLIGAAPSRSAVLTVQPGMQIVVDGHTGCTLAFIVTDEHAESRAVTAGHCVEDAALRAPDRHGIDAVWPEGQGPEVTDADGRLIGTIRAVAHNSVREGFGYADVALIELVGDARIDSDVCGFGVPTGMSARPQPGTSIVHCGHGNVIGTAMHVREGILGEVEPEDVGRGYARAKAVANQGDSGSPVSDSETGEAIGILVTIDLDGPARSGDTVGIVLLKDMLPRIGQAVGVKLTVAAKAAPNEQAGPRQARNGQQAIP